MSSALLRAIESEEIRSELLELVLKPGTDLDVRAADGGSLLHRAITAEPVALELLQAALDRGAEVNATDKNGFTPLALARRQLDELDGADIEEAERAYWQGVTFLQLLVPRACWPDELESPKQRRAKLGQVVDLLRSFGGAVVVDRASAIAWSIYCGDSTELCELCREATRDELTLALCSAVRSANEQLVRTAIAAGADVSAAWYDHRTPLMLAARAGDTGVTQALLDAGAELGATAGNRTALDHAALYGNAEVLALLRRQNAMRDSFASLHIGAPRLVTPVALLAATGVAATAGAFADLFTGCRIERNVWGRQIIPSDECYFLIRPRQMEWTICYPAQLLRRSSINRQAGTSLHEALSVDLLLAYRRNRGVGLIRFEKRSERKITECSLDAYLAEQRAALPAWPVRWPAGDLGQHPLFSFNPQEFEAIALVHIDE
jgi:ankyrin repeat protein